MSEIDHLLEEIETLVINSVKIPFTAKTVLDEDKLIDLLDLLRQNLPLKLKQADEIVASADALMTEAKRRAEILLANAEQQASRFVSETEIVQRALIEAERIRQDVYEEIRGQQAEADRYAEEVLSELEAKISRVLTTIQNGRSQLSAV